MKVLVISQYFPPTGGARALQIQKVAQAIVKRGWQITIVAGLPEGSGLQKLSDGLENSIRFVPYRRNRTAGNLMGRIWNRFWMEIHSVLPGDEWVRRAADEAVRVVNLYKPDVVLSSSTPFQPHRVGRYLKKQTGLPWVASFSDPWPSQINPHPYNAYEMPILKNWQMHWLKKILRHCDGIHMTNQYALNLMAEISRFPIGDKCFAIPHIGSNGNLKSDISNSGWLAYIGHLSRERVSKSLLEAVQISAMRLKKYFHGLLLVGIVCPEFKKLVQEMKLEKLVKFAGTLPHQQAIDISAGSQSLLLIEADMPKSPYLPSKFADYAAAGKPIIAITPPKSPVRDYLRAYGGGCAVGHRTEEICDAIEKTFCSQNLKACSELATHFTSETVGKAYINMFEAILNRREAE